MSDQEDIVSAFEGIVKVSEEGDAEAYIDYITEDAVMMYSEMPAVIGRESVLDFVKQFFGEYEFKFDPWQTDEIIVMGDRAMHRYSGIALVTPKGEGEALRLDRKYIDMMQKVGGGGWKISHHIYNTND